MRKVAKSLFLPNGYLIIEKKEELSPFNKFIVTDNGDGFNTANYASFLEAYSDYKVTKGCKGIGRFLWLKAFEKIHITSNFFENEKWIKREFDFDAKHGIEPENNTVDSSRHEYITVVELIDFY